MNQTLTFAQIEIYTAYIYTQIITYTPVGNIFLMTEMEQLIVLETKRSEVWSGMVRICWHEIVEKDQKYQRWF